MSQAHRLLTAAEMPLPRAGEWRRRSYPAFCPCGVVGSPRLAKQFCRHGKNLARPKTVHRSLSPKWGVEITVRQSVAFWPRGALQPLKTKPTPSSGDGSVTAGKFPHQENCAKQELPFALRHGTKKASANDQVKNLSADTCEFLGYRQDLTETTLKRLMIRTPRASRGHQGTLRLCWALLRYRFMRAG